MERKEYMTSFRREAIFKAAKNNTAGNFLTLIGIWVVTPVDEQFRSVFIPFALVYGLLSLLNIFLGIKYSSELDKKTQRIFEKTYYYSTGIITTALGLFLVYQGHKYGFLSTAHLSTWVFVFATIEACASYLFHAPRFFILIYIGMNLPSAIWLVSLGTPTSYIIAMILVCYGPMIMNRVNELTKLRNQNVSLLEKSKEREQELQKFIDIIPSKLLWIDNNSYISLMNEKMEKIIKRRDTFISRDRLGSSNDELLNEIFNFLDGEEKEKTKELLVSSDNSGDQDRWHLCNFSKVDFGKGDEAFVVAIDIHEDKLLNESLEKQKKISDQASRLVNLGEMASGIAHEINNPIAIAQGTTTLLMNKIEEGKISNEQVKEKLKKIISSHERVIDVIKGMRSFSKKGTATEKTDVRIDDVLKSTLVLCSERFKDYGIKLAVEEMHKDYTYRCTKQDLSQIILSLLNNSFDSIEKKQRDSNNKINIKVEDSDKELTISVIDNGIGIKNPDKIFVPFYTTKSTGTGVGLGLSLSQKIANNYNGRIEASSTGEETVFTLILPY